MNAYALILFVAGLALVAGQKGKVCYHPKEFADRCDDLYLEMVALDSNARMYRDGTSCFIYRPYGAPNHIGEWFGANFDCQQPTSQLGPGELLGGRSPTEMAEIIANLNLGRTHNIWTAGYQPAGGDPAIEPDGGWYWYDGDGPKKQRKINITEAFSRNHFGVQQPDDYDPYRGASPAHFGHTSTVGTSPGELRDIYHWWWEPYVCEYFKCLENEFRDRQPRPNPFVPNGNGAENAHTFDALRGPNN